MATISHKQQVLLLHGAIASAAQMEMFRPLLGDDYELHTMNFAGHGGRPLPDNAYSMEEFADEVNAFIREKMLKPVDVIGYSMGGYAALCAALKDPDNFRSITTLGSKFDWTPESASAEIRLLDADKIKEKIPAFAEMLEARHHPSDWRDVLKKTADMMVLLGADAPLKWEDFSRIRTKVHIMCGERDQSASPEFSAKLATLLPEGRFTMLENSAHPLEKTDLQAFIRAWMEASGIQNR